MDKVTDPSIFVNDGSFMERFKQLQQQDQKGEIAEKSRSGSSSSITSTPKTTISKTTVEFKSSGSQRVIQPPSSGKLAFSLKQKSRLVSPPVKFDEDEDRDDRDAENFSNAGSLKRPKFADIGASDQSSQQVDVAPPIPSDPTVRKVADKLASFVAKNGRQFEDVTRQKNPGDTPFKFLFDENCSDYKYYVNRLTEEQKSLTQSRDLQASQSGYTTPTSATSSQRSHNQQLRYQTPASALYDYAEHVGSTYPPSQLTSGIHGESTAQTGSDPIAMMEFYMKKAAQEEKSRPPKASKDEMPPPASLQASMKKGHHMGDYIPPEELEKFMASCNDASVQKYAKEYADKTKIQADNVGHKLLSKMGWKEGEGLGSSKSGMANPIMAGDVKKDHLGVGAHAPGEVTSEDDIYEQYKKRMMLGYRHRPNPLNNPRKSYY